MRILGIETSCDDTGVAIYDDIKGLIYNKLISQSKTHAIYGGVVPELAARYHLNNIEFLIKEALNKIQFNNKYKIDAIAYTSGPGLVGSLMVGATVASALAFVLEIPVVLVNHMEAHLLSCLLTKKNLNYFKFPFLGLLVSGGHTQLIIANQMGKYEVIGKSVDDAVGETIDKIAQLLGIDYPGGKGLSILARQGRLGQFFFPRPMINHSGFDFSFSGLKTCVSRTILQSDIDKQTRADIAKAFEDAIVDTLVIKCKKAIRLKRIQRLVVAGGVSSNSLLRSKLSSMMFTICKGEAIYAEKKFCTDNAAMIAYTGMLRFKAGNYTESKIDVRPKWIISDVSGF